ncbi:TonB-dependent receptor [Bacteroides sp.]|jgi:tonB-linked outer membrane protein, susC/ragA family|uniref:SusC/RagA family TonB-linked outer membrane protein n=1 Tax=Bacteroides sp. TaxID=29523 RepID=UPI002589BB31|nr:TonB-dependent receptor [Bacteroides sp.]
MKKVFITGIYAILLLGGASLQAMDISPIDVEVTLQNRKITGTIVDQNGEPIIGANVLQKGTTNGTITNIDGCFTLNCPAGALLSISFIGYLQQQVKATDNMKVVLKEDSKTLDEVVVVGYGFVKKSDLTGSVAQVKSEELLKSSPISLEKGLQGRLTGVNVVSNDGAPGGGISIQIRGTNSFQGSTEPLYVIDGVPISDSNDDTINFDSSSPNYSNALSSLNPNDIASIEILKDASATAIYGSRGANGVVLITTKSGSGIDVKDQITLSYKLTSSHTAKKIKVLGARDYAEYRNLSYINTQEVSNFEWEQIDLPFPGTTNSEGAYLKGPDDFDNDPYYWQNQIFRSGLTHDLNLNISGQSKGFDYSVSGGYLNQEGIINGSDYSRYTVKANLNRQVKPWLKFGTSVSGTFAKSNVLKTATNNKNNGTEGVVRSAITYPASQTQEDLDNEYSMVAVPTRYINALNENQNMVFRTSNYLNITLLDGLIFRSVLGYNYTRNDANKYWPSYLAEGKGIGGKSNAGDNWRSSLLFDNLLMYNKTFNRKHNINATVGTSWEESNYYNKTITVQGFGTDDTQGWLLQDAGTMTAVSSGKGDSQLFSLIGRFAYNYAGKYYLTFTARNDVSSKFAKGKRAAFFPSIGLSYRLSEEKFMKGLSNVLSNIKFRYSYGASGNQAIGSYQTFAIMAAANYPFGSNIENGYATNTYNPGNKELTWETTWQHDLGLELMLFKRVSLEFDYYHKKTTNLLQYKQTPPSTGIEQILSNSGAVVNKGFEASMKVFAIQGKDFSLSFGGNISFNKNEICDFGKDPMFPNSIYNSMRPYALADNHPIGAFYGWVHDGIWQSKEEVVNSHQFKTQYPDYQANNSDAATEEIIRRDWIGEIKYKDLDEDGFITDKDQDWIGDANPDFYYGFNFDLNWKNLDLSILFQGVEGNDIFNMNALRFYDLGNTRNVPYYVYEQSWSVNPQTAVAPKIFYYSGRDVRFSRLYLDDGSYLKLRSLSIGYTIKKPLPYINSIRLSATGNNLLTFTKYKGYDPEVNSFGSTPSLRGIDSGAYPQQRSFTFGLNVVF